MTRIPWETAPGSLEWPYMVKSRATWIFSWTWPHGHKVAAAILPSSPDKIKYNVGGKKAGVWGGGKSSLLNNF